MRSTETGAGPTAGQTRAAGAAADALLRINQLDVHYGQAHALQGVSLSLHAGVLAVVGRNGMGKSTLCKAITGLVPASGSVLLAGAELLGRSPDQITHLGVAYVPQGRRVWRSLTVDETLRLSAKTARQGAWTVARVYQVFPRLAERRHNGGGQLSGGEQQMLAIARALLFNPRLLVMDEPTEGLAPVIVEQVATLLKALADERSMSVLLIEQNLGVALEVADEVAIMVNGRIAHCLPAATLAADRALQQRLLGLKAGASDAVAVADAAAPGAAPAEAGPAAGAAPVWRVLRAHGPHSLPAHSEPAVVDLPLASRPVLASAAAEGAAPGRTVVLAGHWGAQQRELAYVRGCLERLGAQVLSVDIAGSGFSSAQVGARELLRHHPQADMQAAAATATTLSADALALAFPAWLASRRDLAALLVVAGADTAAVGLAGALSLPTGVPKLVVSDRPLPAADADVLVMTAALGALNRVSETLLAHAAAAVVGMLRGAPASRRTAKPLVAITTLDLAGAAVRHTRRALGDGVDCLLLDMAAGGGQTLTRLAPSGLLAGVIDLAPVDLSRAFATGRHGPAQERIAALRASGLPYLLVPALLALTSFAPGQAVPATLLQRSLHSSASDGSIVPLLAAEAQGLGDWLAAELNSFTGPAALLLPQPSTSTWQPLGGDLPTAALQQALQQNLLRRIRPRRALHCAERPDTLHDMRFGEAVGAAMRTLIQERG